MNRRYGMRNLEEVIKTRVPRLKDGLVVISVPILAFVVISI